MATSAIFWDRIAKRYSKSPISNQEAYERKLEITRSYFTPETKILEFGCGTGSTAILHAPLVKHIHAIDISEKMLDIARQKAETQNIENITFEQKAIEDLDDTTERYDVILGMSILHLLEDKKSAMLKVHRMLKPGGVFISSTFCGRGKAKLLRPFIALGSMVGLLPQVNFFSPESLQMSVKDAGFRLDHVWKPEKSDALFLAALKPKS